MPLSHEIHVDGHKLVALELNPQRTGTPIILLHGVTLSVNFWLTDAVFPEHGPCYALSLPGHYPATLPSNFSETLLTPETIIRVLAQAVRRLVGEQPVILVGHSTGGFSALALAALQPGLACSVISLAGFAQGRWIGFYGLQQKIARQGEVGRWLFKLGFQSGALHHAIYRQGWRVVVSNTKTFFAYPRLDALITNTYADARQLDLQAMSYYFRAMPNIDITPLLPRITVPTLVITGDRDPTVPPAQAPWIAQHVPNSKLVVVPQVGHMLFAENPTRYAEILKDWLKEIR
jgi:pimeloyl-ACP methyl ester carboxylesterase